MPTTRDKPTEVACTRCSRTSLMPEPGDYTSMWDAGWRWRGAPERAGIAKFVPDRFAFSCPDCPPVL